MAKFYLLYLAVRMHRYGSLIKINPSDACMKKNEAKIKYCNMETWYDWNLYLPKLKFCFQNLQAYKRYCKLVGKIWLKVIVQTSYLFFNWICTDILFATFNQLTFKYTLPKCYQNHFCSFLLPWYVICYLQMTYNKSVLWSGIFL